MMKRFTLGMLLLLFFSASCLAVGEGVKKSTGQHIYVPVYSHIYGGNRERPFNLAVTLSIRNIDGAGKITVTKVDYYDSDGKLVKHYLDRPREIGPMASVRYIVRESDTSGGSGANFIVTWGSETPVDPPLIESVMIGTQSQQGISFTSRGQVISE